MTAGDPAPVALHELDEAEDALHRLEERYLRLLEFTDGAFSDRDGGQERFERAARRIASGRDRAAFDAVRACLVVVGEIDLGPDDVGGPAVDGG